MTRLIAVPAALCFAGVWSCYAQPATVCNVSNSQTNGYVLTATTTGGNNCAWRAGGGVPGGSNTQVQFNDGGVFGGGSGFTFDKTTGNATIGTTVLCASIGVNTGTSYTLTSANNGCVLTFNNAGAITLTVPAGLPVGFSCLIVQLGAGAVTPTASGVTINQRQSFTKTAGQYALATLVSYATDIYAFGGDLQ